MGLSVHVGVKLHQVVVYILEITLFREWLESLLSDSIFSIAWQFMDIYSESEWVSEWVVFGSFLKLSKAWKVGDHQSCARIAGASEAFKREENQEMSCQESSAHLDVKHYSVDLTGLDSQGVFLRQLRHKAWHIKQAGAVYPCTDALAPNSRWSQPSRRPVTSRHQAQKSCELLSACTEIWVGDLVNSKTKRWRTRRMIVSLPRRIKGTRGSVWTPQNTTGVMSFESWKLCTCRKDIFAWAALCLWQVERVFGSSGWPDF